ncbi:MAG: hypothetical protein M9904_02410 [Chitinophagaceae bacterium]|nr:hypothetical protein [Chitinophagaceae bacterium]
MKRRLKIYLQLYDGVWSVPLAFLGFWFLGIMLSLMGTATGVYDISFIQPLLLAAAIVIGAANIALGGLYFTFRGFYRFLYGQVKPDTGEFLNFSKINWKKLLPWQQFAISLSVFFFFFWAVIIVYLKLV